METFKWWKNICQKRSVEKSKSGENNHLSPIIQSFSSKKLRNQMKKSKTITNGKDNNWNKRTCFDQKQVKKSHFGALFRKLRPKNWARHQNKNILAPMALLEKF